MNEYNKLNKLLKNKKILYIPIYSCFNYQTFKLNFKADGNINRFLSTFINCNSYKSITIFEPIDGVDKDWFDDVCHTYLNDCKLIECNLIEKSAKVERSIKFSFDIIDFIKENNIDLNSFDYIICEAQHLFLRFYNSEFKDKLIYWCPVCATNDKTRDFLEPYKEIEKYIFSISKIVILASNDQVNFFNTIINHGECIQINKMIDRKLPIFDYEVNNKIIEYIKSFNNDKNIFLPFRLTDMGYCTQEIIDFLYNEYKSKNYKVFYSNPNNCDIYRFANNDNNKKAFLDTYFIEVPKNREVFYSIIDYCNVIIPYFEDLDFIAHSSIFEFECGNCKVCKTLDNFKELLLS